MQPFRLLSSIPQDLFEPNKDFQAASSIAASMSYLASADELFVVAPGNRTVNSLSPVVTESTLCPVYTTPLSEVPSSVCFIRQTRTLLIAKFSDGNTEGTKNFSIVALSRDGQNWLQQSELPLQIAPPDSCEGSTLCELPESTVLFGADRLKSLFLLKLTPGDQLELLHEVNTPEGYHSVSATSSKGRTLVTLSLAESNAVSLSQLAGDQLEELSRLGGLLDGYTHFVLWCGEHLLLAQTTQEGMMEFDQRVEELDTSNSSIAPSTWLISGRPYVELDAWCCDGERLIVWDRHSHDVMVYNIASHD